MQTIKRKTRLEGNPFYKPPVAEPMSDISVIPKGTPELMVSIKDVWTSFKKPIVFILWDFSGLRYVASLMYSPLGKKSYFPDTTPPTFIIWLLGIYVALFGIASQRYENMVDIIENRANTLLSQYALSNNKETLSRIPNIQRMACPSKPAIFTPSSVFQSFGLTIQASFPFIGTQVQHYPEVAMLLLQTLEDNRSQLTQINLAGGLFNHAHLWEAQLAGSDLFQVQLSDADLYNANLEGVFFKESTLVKTNFNSADASFADFSQADLSEASFQGARVTQASFEGATLRGTDFRGVIGLHIGQLALAKTLKEAKFDSDLRQEVQAQLSHLIE